LEQVFDEKSADYAMSTFTNSVERAMQQNQQDLAAGRITQAEAAVNYQALQKSMEDFSANVTTYSPGAAGRMIGDRFSPGGKWYDVWQRYAVEPPPQITVEDKTAGVSQEGTDLIEIPVEPLGGKAQTDILTAGEFDPRLQRQSIEKLLGVPIQQLTSQYDQIRRNILETLPAGGARDQALANLEQSKARDLGQLFLTAPQIGAEALTNIGLGLAPTSTTALSNLLYGSLGLMNQLGQQSQRGLNFGVGIGNILGSLLFGRRGGNNAQQQSSLSPYMGSFF